MNRQSILVSIHQSISNINWKTPKEKEKALTLCSYVFNLYTKYGYKFTDYLSLSSNYFTTVLPSKRDYVIKKKLEDNGIFEVDGSYNVVKGIAKGYRFGKEIFGQATISSSINSFTYSTTATISYLFPHSNGLFLNAFYEGILDRLTFLEDIDDLINELSEISLTDLILNENIPDQYIYILNGNRKERYSKGYAIELAKHTGNDLIQFKDKCYIDEPNSFIEHKSRQLKITYCQNVFNIKNKLFYCSRNDTNNRLDYNLTGLKKELFDKLMFDGEKLIELDIANAQFAIAAHLNAAIDDNFSDHAQTGKLYGYIENELKLSTGSGKQLMFRIAFDKVKSITEYENIRSLFPKFMNWVDNYKNSHGYKMFSNLLQKKEAEIMIDGLLYFLIEKGYEVFTIHDALRVKQSQADEINGLVVEYFNSIGFKCLVRRK